MKRVITVLPLILYVILGWPQSLSAAGPPSKAMGDVKGVIDSQWWHSFQFTAVAKGSVLDGRGYLRHLRLLGDATTVSKKEVCQVEYLLTEADSAWVACRVIYYSEDPDPTHWIVIYAIDGGQPGGGGDMLYWTREFEGEDAALARLQDPNTAGMRRVEITNGNLKVIER